MVLEIQDIGLTVLLRGSERTLLEPLSLVIRPGEVLGVMGPSGAGKSTLLRLVVGLESRSGGRVVLDGCLVQSAGLPGFRSHVMLVPQDVHPGEGTPADFLDRIRRYDTRKASWPERSAFLGELAALGLEAETLLRPWEQLSGGEQRRMLLALVLALEPDYLLLDEAASGLDTQAEDRLVARLLRAREEGRGLLLVSHSEMFMARLADRMVVLFDGAAQAEGTVRELIPAAWAESGRSRAS